MSIDANTLAQSQQLIAMVRESSEGWMTLWTLFHTIAAAVVAVVASEKLLPTNRTLVALAAGALFLLFSAGNYTALCAIREQRVAIIDFVKSASAGQPAIGRFADAAQPPLKEDLARYHWGMQAFVVLVIFGLQFRGKVGTRSVTEKDN